MPRTVVVRHWLGRTDVANWASRTIILGSQLKISGPEAYVQADEIICRRTPIAARTSGSTGGSGLERMQQMHSQPLDNLNHGNSCPS